MNNEQLTVGELVYKISGDMSNLQVELKKAEAEITNLKASMEKTAKTTDKTTKGFNGLATAVKASIVGFISSQLIGFVQKSVEMATKRYEAETILAQTLRVSTNATNEQIASLKKQRDELEKVGVVEDDVIASMQGRLAQFDLSTESIKTLTPAILDYVVAEKGANATAEDATARANGLAQALQGNFASLTKVGFVLDENTKKMISNGTEAEKVKAIVDVLNSTYEGQNKLLGGTFLGTQKKVANEMQQWREDLGFAFIPAIQNLSGELLGMSGEFNSGADRINVWGKALYQASQIVIGFARVVKTAFGGIKTVVGIVDVGVKATTKSFIDVAKTAGDVVGANTTKLTELSVGMDQVIKESSDKVLDNADKTKQSYLEVGKAFEEAYNADNFKPVTEASIAQWKKMKESTDAVGEASEETKKKLEKYQDGIRDVALQSQKASKEIEDSLVKSTKEFGKSIGENLNETGQSLAKIVVDAKDKIKSLKEEITKSDDTEQITKLQEQVSEQEKIIKSSSDFEERQAKRIADVKKKLADAGIDTTKAGLDNIFTTKTLEDQITEQTRISKLNEFELFEEQQAKKLETLTNDYIVEVALLQQKYQAQKGYEADLTTFMDTENAKRIDATEKWAIATINKYKEVADSLKNLLPSTTQIKNFSNGYGNISPVAPSSVSATPQNMTPANSVTNNNKSTVVNAPVSISGNNLQGLGAKEISAILGFELNKFIK